MKLYYTKGACSLACRIVINELGIPVDYVSVDLKSKQTEDGLDFKQINPKGAVPVLETGDKEILTENAVIQQYLADQSKAYDLLPKLGTFARYQVLEWLNYVATELHKGFSVFFHPNITEAMKQNIFIPQMEYKLTYINDSLDEKKYLLGNDFTLPDAYLFVMLTWALHFQFRFKNWPNINRYFNELKKRDSISHSLKQEKLALSED